MAEGPVARKMREKLAAAFSPVRLDLLDESARHAGHAGARPEGETHFRLTIVAASFRGKSRLERERMVHAVLAEELRGPVHALNIKAEPDAESSS